MRDVFGGEGSHFPLSHASVRITQVAWRRNGSAPDPGDLLREVMELRGLSVRGLAKELAGGEGAAEEEWRTQRRMLTDWLRGARRKGHDPSEESLERLAVQLKLPAEMLKIVYRQHAAEELARREIAHALEVLEAAQARLTPEQE